MYSTRCMVALDWDELRFFNRSEFHNPDAMGYEFMLWIDRMRAAAGVALHPSSDHRTSEHNKEVGGADHSAHLDTPCDAMDFGQLDSHTRFRLVFAAMKLGCKRIGIYPNGSVHIDRAGGKVPGDDSVARANEVLWITAK